MSGDRYRVTVRCRCGHRHTWTVLANQTEGTQFALTCPSCLTPAWFTWDAANAQAKVDA